MLLPNLICRVRLNGILNWNDYLGEQRQMTVKQTYQKVNEDFIESAEICFHLLSKSRRYSQRISNNLLIILWSMVNRKEKANKKEKKGFFHSSI